MLLAGAGEACIPVRHSFKMSVNFFKKTDSQITHEAIFRITR